MHNSYLHYPPIILAYIILNFTVYIMTPTPPISKSVDAYGSSGAADKERRYVSFMHLFVLFWKHIFPVHPIRMIKWHLPPSHAGVCTHTHDEIMGPEPSGKRIDHSIKWGKPLLRSAAVWEKIYDVINLLLSILHL